MTLLPDPTIGLVFDGDLDLNGSNTDPSGAVFHVEALGEGTSWGNPEAITRMVTSWLQDGSVVTHDRDDNREITIPIRLRADTSVALAAGEAALMHRCGRSTTLAWTPPWDDDEAITTLFEVWGARMDGDLQAGEEGDLNELRVTRYYTLTMTAKPYSRSVDLLSYSAVALPTGDPVSESLDDGTSATGWTSTTGTAAAALGSVGTSVTTIKSSRKQNGPFNGAPRYRMNLTRTFSSAVDMSDSPYLMIDFSVGGRSWIATVKADGTPLTLVAQVGSQHYYKRETDFTVLSVNIDYYTVKALTVIFAISQITRTDRVGPAVTTSREMVKTAWTHGSARTNGLISVEHESDGLGDVIVYTAPSQSTGYVPMMQQYQTAGPTPVSDTDAVTGVKQLISDFDSVPTFTIPSDQLIRGDYGIVARLKSADPQDYNVVFQANVEGHSTAAEVGIARTVITVGDTADDSTAADYKILWLGSITLPPLAIPEESDQNIVVTLTALPTDFISGGTGDVYMDELWLFNLTDGAVTIVHADSAQRVWLESADADQVNPMVWLGSEDDRSDAVGATLSSRVMSLGNHAMLPGYMDLFTVTTGADGASTSVSYYPRWHTHAAL